MEPDDSNSHKMLSKARLRYGMSISGILRKFQGQGQVTKKNNYMAFGTNVERLLRR